MQPGKNLFRTALGPIAAVTALAGFALAPASALHARKVTLDSGTVVAVRLTDDLSSNNSHTGDKFTATVPHSTKNGLTNTAAFPSGTQIEGVVREAQPKKDKNPGVLDLAFRRIILPNGSSYSINGSLIALDSKSVTQSGGRLIAKNGHRTNRLTYVGIGAGAGLVLGQLTHKKDTIRDTVIGAGLGYLAGALQKGHSDARDVTLKSGTELGVRLDRGVTFDRVSSAR